jgi:hypothetical protein
MIYIRANQINQVQCEREIVLVYPQFSNDRNHFRFLERELRSSMIEATSTGTCCKPTTRECDIETAYGYWVTVHVNRRTACSIAVPGLHPHFHK